MHLNDRKPKHLEVMENERPDSVMSTCSEPTMHRRNPAASVNQRRSSLPAGIRISMEVSPAKEVGYQSGLQGNVISSFYTMWRYSKPSRPLGRGKLELPSSMKLHDKYRECGCLSRIHVRQCKIRGCCNLPS